MKNLSLDHLRPARTQFSCAGCLRLRVRPTARLQVLPRLHDHVLLSFKVNFLRSAEAARLNIGLGPHGRVLLSFKVMFT